MRRALGAGLMMLTLVACERTPASDPAREAAVTPATVVAPAAATAPSAAPAATPASTVTATGWISASTRAVTRDGELSISGNDGHAIHTHGGDAAPLGRATFTVKNDSARVRTVTAKQVEFLTGHDCKQPPTKVRSRPKLERVVPESDHDERPPSLSFAVPAKSEVKLRVSFESVQAYTTHCDRFAFRVSFDVDGKETVAAVAEIKVEREEPDPGP